MYYYDGWLVVCANWQLTVPPMRSRYECDIWWAQWMFVPERQDDRPRRSGDASVRHVVGNNCPSSTMQAEKAGKQRPWEQITESARKAVKFRERGGLMR